MKLLRLTPIMTKELLHNLNDLTKWIGDSMKKHKDLILIGAILIGLSVVLHYVHYVMFHDMHHLLIFLVADIAFIPLEVFFVTVVIDRILEKREKSHLIEKLNMLVGLFFSEVGLNMLTACADVDPNLASLKGDFALTMNWTEADFENLTKKLKSHDHCLDASKMDIGALKTSLDESKDLLVTLIANPSLLEHDSFSGLLMAVMHLQEELVMRYDNGLSEFDLEHIQFDIERVYKHLGVEWIKYMQHLKDQFPYLYLTALINNPYMNKDRVISEKELRSQMR